MTEGKIGRYVRIINQFPKKREREKETNFKKIAEMKGKTGDVER